jgi:hypothetical protein
MRKLGHLSRNFTQRELRMGTHEDELNKNSHEMLLVN